MKITDTANCSRPALTWGGDSAYVAWSTFRERGRVEVARLRWVP